MVVGGGVSGGSGLTSAFGSFCWEDGSVLDGSVSWREGIWNLASLEGEERWADSSREKSMTPVTLRVNHYLLLKSLSLLSHYTNINTVMQILVSNSRLHFLPHCMKSVIQFTSLNHFYLFLHSPVSITVTLHVYSSATAYMYSSLV